MSSWLLMASISSCAELHVLLRHRLLPQPGGFEGLLARRVLATPNDDLAVPHRVDARVSRCPSSASLPFGRATIRRTATTRVASIDQLRLDPHSGRKSRATRPSNGASPRGPERPRCHPARPRSPANRSPGPRAWQPGPGRGRSTPRGCCRTISTFSCDIAYSDSPAASRASASVLNPMVPLTICAASKLEQASN